MRKNKLIILVFFVLTTILVSAQQLTTINSAGGNFELTLTPELKDNNSESFKKIAPKMYLTQAFLPAKIEGIEGEFYLRYNIFRDEMEYSKNGKTFYLQKKKEIGITFNKSKDEYRLFKLNNKLSFFLVLNSGSNILLNRKIVEYQKAVKATNSYQRDKSADFRRKKDEIYIKFKNNNTPVEVPSNKNKFYALFGKNQSKIKSYIKENKLNIKKTEHLKSIIEYYNTI